MTFSQPINAQTVDTVGYFHFDGNFNNEIFDTSLLLETDTNNLVIENDYLRLVNDIDNDIRKGIRFYVNTNNANKLIIQSKGYYIKNDNYTISGFTIRDDQDKSLSLSHNYYFFPGSDEVGQYTYRENVYLNNIESGPDYIGVEKYMVSEMLDLSFDQWITETIVIDYVDSVATYTRELADGITRDTVSIDTLIFSRNDTTEIYINASDWAAGAEHHVDSLIISIEQMNSDTCYFTVYDTIVTEVFDTTFVTVYDTIAVTDTLIIDVTITGITPPDDRNTLLVYPNPTNDVIYINTGSNYQNMTDYTLKIVNTLGQTVFENFIDNQLFTVDVNTFGETGLYYVYIIDNNSQIIDIRKIILE